MGKVTTMMDDDAVDALVGINTSCIRIRCARRCLFTFVMLEKKLLVLVVVVTFDALYIRKERLDSKGERTRFSGEDGDLFL